MAKGSLDVLDPQRAKVEDTRSEHRVGAGFDRRREILDLPAPPLAMTGTLTTARTAVIIARS